MTIRLKEAAQRLLVAAGLLVGAASPALAEDIYAQYCEPCPPVANPCPPPMVTDQPSATPTPMDADGQAPPNPVPADPAPIDLGADAPQVDLSPPPSNNALAQASRSQSNFAPNMIGDFFGNSLPLTVIPESGGSPVTLSFPNPGAGDFVGRPRIGDNNSAKPTDRIYFDYNLFHNTTLTALDGAGGIADPAVDVNRFSFGFEKTFFDGMASVEVKVPTASTLSSDLDFSTPSDFIRFELGNILIAPKLLLRENCDRAIAVGLGVSLPTADDLNLNAEILGVTQTVFSIRNDAAHLIPYVAYLLKPTDEGYFGHFFVSADTALGSNDVFFDDGAGLAQVGEFRNQTLLSIDLSLGRWLYENQSQHAKINGFAWTTELHYTTTFSDADTLTFGATDNLALGSENTDFSLLNGTFGGHVRVGLTTFTAAYTTPFTSSDRVFDGEFRFFLNRNF